jgi:ATP-dependent helicase/nuclease subunit A
LPTELLLPFDEDPAPRDPLVERDEAARAFAVDPARNVVLEASAGTGKTRVLVTRYVNLLRAGVDPANILAITFTRKAAAEMRERILAELRAMAERSAPDAARWRELRDRLGEIGIKTIDAFCLSLLREFPLEADLDPGFDVADETEVPRFLDEALDAALRAARRLVGLDEDVALVMAALGERKVRAGLAVLVDRRLVAGQAIRRFTAGSRTVPAGLAFGHALGRLAGFLESGPGGLDAFLRDGPVDHPAFALLEADLRSLTRAATARLSDPAALACARASVERVSGCFLTKDGAPRKKPAPHFGKDQCVSPDAWKRHSQAIASLSPYVAETLAGLQRDLNVAMARGVERLFGIARRRYRRALEAQASVDFTEALARTLALLDRMDEFAQSRYRLEARYHHVLVDEFQDTSRAQWRLVARLVESWGEGIGLAHDAPLQPSVFVVGDRKQSIYGFRDADVRMLRRARRYIRGLRPAGDVRRTIARSFRSAAPLLAFANDLFGAVEHAPGRPDAFRYAARDRFPVHLAGAPASSADALGVAAGSTQAEVAAAIATEVERLLSTGTVRDRQTGIARMARPGDIAVLFRSRESHREFESALDARGIPTYVYKGLGFFDADEVKDLVALLRFLADPASPARAAAFLRSRFVRLSDAGLRALGPGVATKLTPATPERRAAPAGPGAPVLQGTPVQALSDEDARVLGAVRAALPEWLALVDRVPPAELVDRVLVGCAYGFELHGPREAQARENVKKIRALLRRIQNRGYATLPRIADHLNRLSAGDESNAVADAVDAVNLMTVHAAKGLEFPIVFLVNVGRGTGSHPDPVLVVADPRRTEPLVSIDGGLPEAEAALRERDLEETKRLLYVAVTRARERLYLSAVVKDGRLRVGRGSLAEVIPAGIRELLARAALEHHGNSITWQGPGGHRHSFRVCGTLAEGVQGSKTDGRSFAPAAERPTDACDFDAWRDEHGIPRVPVTRLVGDAEAGQASPSADAGLLASSTPASEAADRPAMRLAGTLVHRLFQAFDRIEDADDETCVLRHARSLVSPEELADVDEPETTLSRAVAAFLDLRRRPDVAVLLAGAQCLYEVPFSMLADTGLKPRAATAATKAIVRGTIDCLAKLPDGRVIVVEIKTGQARDWHQDQLEWYLTAARALFPGDPVEGVVLYA